MPICQKIKKKKRTVCVGDMRDLITLQSRSITPPTGSSVDFAETFSGLADIWAAVNTVSGETLFDGTGTERDVTHRVYIRYMNNVTAETWVLFNNDRLDVLDVEDLDERHEFLLLRCSNRGTDANEANSG